MGARNVAAGEGAASEGAASRWAWGWEAVSERVPDAAVGSAEHAIHGFKCVWTETNAFSVAGICGQLPWAGPNDSPVPRRRRHGVADLPGM